MTIKKTLKLSIYNAAHLIKGIIRVFNLIDMGKTFRKDKKFIPVDHRNARKKKNKKYKEYKTNGKEE